MQFKKVTRLSGLSLLVASIVVPAGSSVNQNATNGTTQMQMADGRWYAFASVTAF
jgi:hypothetical protein